MKIKSFIIPIVLIMLLFSCAAEEPAMTFDGNELSLNEYRYMLSTYKYLFSRTYDGFTDTDEYYSMTYSDGTTYGEVLDDIALYNIKVSLVTKSVFDTKGYVLDEKSTEKVEDYIDGLIKSAGGKTELNSKLREFGINCDMLREINLNSAKNDALITELFADGTLAADDTARDEYLEDGYVRFLHLYLTGENRYKSESVDAELSAGKDFADVYAEYSEDRLYDDGYYLRRDSEFFSGVADAAFSLEVGEYTKLESEYGVHYVMRLDGVDGAYGDSTYYDFFTDFESRLKEKIYSDYINGLVEKVEVNNDVIGDYSVKNVPINSEY